MDEHVHRAVTAGLRRRGIFVRGRARTKSRMLCINAIAFTSYGTYKLTDD
ncbi:MAG: hypothetical protein KME25_16225 [Symplocastrum torsivum CPER-KK1]|uniref:Uncharacterized protein n=1 Tax=Symplocastrum torsivum CPER-KK1 TaxID=450513 RepID=A0A951PMN0_9CYAN|nr:hypothetical protein [Symplocastrum torsivum CPER-KK1]